uniref:Uncharacterized protein n=1 Tax=Knipowitschia caucasica TaxID=637954 RepID=A0AAV2K5V6_KNICA
MRMFGCGSLVGAIPALGPESQEIARCRMKSVESKGYKMNAEVMCSDPQKCLFTKGWVELPKVEIPRSKELTWSTITVFLAVSYGPKRTPLPKGLIEQDFRLTLKAGAMTCLLLLLHQTCL